MKKPSHVQWPRSWVLVVGAELEPVIFSLAYFSCVINLLSTLSLLGYNQSKSPPPLSSIFPLNCSSWNIFPLKSVSLTRKHFPLRNENNFPLRYENNFPLSNENNYPLRNENNYPLRNENNFPLRNANNFLLRNANNFALWKENIVRIENNFFNANKLLCPLRTLTIRDHLIQRTFQHVA